VRRALVIFFSLLIFSMPLQAPRRSSLAYSCVLLPAVACVGFAACYLTHLIRNRKPTRKPLIETTVLEPEHVVLSGIEKKLVWLNKRMIEQPHCLKQNNLVDCGYYAVHFAECMASQDILGLNNQEAYDRKTSLFKRAVEISRQEAGGDNLFSYEIEMILGHQKNIVIVDHLEILERFVVTGIESPETKKITKLLGRGKPIIFVVNSAKGNPFANDRHTGVWHWFAAMIEYDNEETAKMTVANSLESDVRNNNSINRLFYIVEKIREKNGTT